MNILDLSNCFNLDQHLSFNQEIAPTFSDWIWIVFIKDFLLQFSSKFQPTFIKLKCQGSLVDYFLKAVTKE